MNNQKLFFSRVSNYGLITLVKRFQQKTMQVLSGYVLRVNRSIIVFFTLFTPVAFIYMAGCGPDPATVAIVTTDCNEGITAVEKLTDQKLLAKISAEDKDPDVRRVAQTRLDGLLNLGLK